jgi:DNA primase
MISNHISSWDDGYVNYKLAGSTDLKILFKIYNIEADEYNKHICCPLPLHDDESPSFNYYPETNSYNCFGCHSGGGPIEFLSSFLSIGKKEAACKILKYQDLSYDILEKQISNNISDRQTILFNFSTYLNKLIKKNINSNYIKSIEHNTFIFDQVYNSRKLNNEALVVLIDKIKLKLED